MELVIERGTAENLTRRVNGPVYMIGTNNDCDMVLSDQQFSDYHTYLCLREGQVTLRHLGQRPLVTVNGRKIRWVEILDDDRIRMGPYEFLVRIRPHSSECRNVWSHEGEEYDPASQVDSPSKIVVPVKGTVGMIAPCCPTIDAGQTGV